MKLSRRHLKRARARRLDEDRILRESVLPVAGPCGEILGMIAAIGEGRGRRYFVVREGVRGYMIAVSRSYVMLGSAMRLIQQRDQLMVKEDRACHVS